MEKLYLIPAENMEALEKRFQSVEKKAQKYGCEVKMFVRGTVYKSYTGKSGEVSTRKYYQVAAEGKVQIEGWKFLATLEHQNGGNIIRSFSDGEIPEKYRTCGPWCDHCKQDRRRKDTYLIQNVETGAIKQVGKSCLLDYTKGMTPAHIALLESFMHDLEEKQETIGGGYTAYYEPEKVLRYAVEVIRFFGYVKSDQPESTKQKTLEFIRYDAGYRLDKITCRKIENTIEQGFDPNRSEVSDYVGKMLTWISGADDSRSDYIYNLKLIAGMNYIEYKHFGYLVSLVPAFERENSRRVEREKTKQAENQSTWQGEKGKRIKVKISSADIVTSWENQYGITKIWKILDAEGNVYIWKTTNNIPECTEIIGTVKEHDEFNGTKQTILTRCKCA